MNQKQTFAENDTERFMDAKQAKEEIEKVIDYMLEIFKEIGCSNKDHITPAVSICMQRGCYTQLLCNQCLIEQMEHTNDH